MTRGRKSKTKKLIQYYGEEFAREFQEKKDRGPRELVGLESKKDEREPRNEMDYG